MSLAFEAIEQLRNFVEGEEITDADELEARLIAAIPREDHARGFAASLAEDALAAAAYGIRCVSADDPMNAVWASRRAYEAVDRYAASLQNETAFTKQVEANVVRHPVVQSELRRQQRDIEELRRMAGHPHALRTVINRAAEEPLIA